MVNLNCFFLLSLIAYFYLKLTEDLFTIASGCMPHAGNNDIFYGPMTGAKALYLYNKLHERYFKC